MPIRKKPIIRLSTTSDVPSPVSPERSSTNATYYSAPDQELRPADGDDRTSNAPPPSMNGIEFAGRDPAPPEIDDSTVPSDLSAVTIRSDRSQGLETFKAALDVFEGIRTSVVSVEDSAMMIKRLEKKADRSFKRTYISGNYLS